MLAAIVLTGIGVWLFQSAFFEASSKVASHLQDSLTVRFAVDPYIWSPSASRRLRRRYVVAQAILAVAALLWAQVAWTSDLRPVAIILTVMAIGIVCLLTFRSIRHGL